MNRSIKFIHTLHNLAAKTSGKWWQRWINRFFYKYKFIQPVVISDQCRISYEKFYFLYNAHCIENGCDMPHSTKDLRSVRDEIEAYKASKDILVFIHVARYHEQKNQRLLIDAFNFLASKGENFVLLVLGDGFDRGAGREIKDAACDKIHFLGLKSNVADYMLCSDAFCLTSKYEGLPISLLEALACGLTPICTKVGGIPDVIEDSINGYLSESTVESYVSSIHKFFNKKIDKEALIQYFRHNYSMDICTGEYLKIYK